MDFSPKALRSRWKELTKKAEALDKKLQPLREELDGLVSGKGGVTVAKAREREPAVRTKIKELQEQMYPVEMERAAVARALNGKTGDPDDEE